ncbi:Homeobox protein HOX1A [Acorus calamus]|uniref:Homeobox protein HOX1A n=1 Tax=Acorus calamus TaxID=4465 RepID=A0AAV9ETY6_ACOCL|nr:Homeobox protein HOX1A [Acorus calamus]
MNPSTPLRRSPRTKTTQTPDQTSDQPKPSPNKKPKKTQPDLAVVEKSASPAKPDPKSNSKDSPAKKKKAPPKFGSRKYTLRSSGTRVLRSRSSKEVNKEVVVYKAPVVEAVSAKGRGKKRKRSKKATKDDEFASVRRQVRYMLKRMGYEQSLIDAYATGGWKGLSLEKLRPEKELQRAKSEILRCKKKIRDIFKNLDSQLSNGRLEESLFDSEGEIDSEDIFCAKCGSENVALNNDIILCDGACDRGFHQMCLEPPLLNEDIPTGDESWLCPACDCKLDCIDLLNDTQGVDLSINEGWEKIFPEAAAVGDGHLDDIALPSDDSEDDNYDPDVQESGEEDQEEGSSSEESDYSSCSDDLVALVNNGNGKLPGFSSDDSEDDDYDPEGPDPDEKVQNDGSRSSDFTSDTDDLGAPLGDNEFLNSDEHAESRPISHSIATTSSGKGNGREKNKELVNSELLHSFYADQSQRTTSFASGRRHHDQPDHKNVHDETYGNNSFSSSDDEDWTDVTPVKKEKKGNVRNGDIMSLNGDSRTSRSRKSSKVIKGKCTEDDSVQKPIYQYNTFKDETMNTHKGKAHQKLDFGGTYNSKPTIDPNFAAKEIIDSSHGKLKREITQRLLENFKENAYPSRDKKQQMVETLGITYQQVCKWFENARRSARESTKKNHGSEFTSSREGTVLWKSNQRDHKSEQRVLKNSSNNGDQENGSSEVMAISIDRGKKKISNEVMVSDNNYSPDDIGELVMAIAAEISPDDRGKEDGSAEVSMDDMDKTKESSMVGGTAGRVGGGQRKKQAVRKIYGGGGKQLVKQWNSAKLELLKKREKMGTQSPVGTSNSR